MLILVAGFGRCGSSLVLEMLEAGGVAVHCDERLRGTMWECTQLLVGVDWGVNSLTAASMRLLGELAASPAPCAVKLIAPFRLPVGLPAVCLWIDRDPEQQAQSMAQRDGRPRLIGEDLAKRVRWLEFWRQSTLGALAAYRVHRLSFEALVTHPEAVTARIAEFLAPIPLRLSAMASRVVIRDPACAIGRPIEVEKVRRVMGPGLAAEMLNRSWG